ncbi:lipase [Amylostereum chailletii]|nr:lipase [Amylostereum chailletii]
MVSGALLVVTLLTGIVHAAVVTKRQAVSPLSAAQIATFKPYTSYASAAYCEPSTTVNWSCGSNCDANSGFQPFASGGNGDDIQFWYVGFDPSLKTVIVGRQGTDTQSIEAVLTDVNIKRRKLDTTLFPGISSSIEVHDGFADSQAKSANDILVAVRSTLSKNSSKSVTVVGHSLGAALGLIDSVFLSLQLGSGVKVTTIGYGLPRVGNEAFANYVDAHQHVTHISNKKDPVPIIPGRGLGFAHPSGEVHIAVDNSDWNSCPGQDSTATDCTIYDVPNIFESDSDDHDGPYDGLTIGC